MSNQELESRVKNIESMLFRVIDFMAIGADKINSYMFINEEIVRRELELDFIMMERTMASNFTGYCNHIFFQIENLFNYYYYIRFLNKGPEAITYFTTVIDGKSIPGKEKVSDISFSTKSIQFSKEFLNGKSLNFEIQKIAYVRNSSIHKNPVDIISKEEAILKEYERVKLIDKTNRTKEEKKAYQKGTEVEFKRGGRFDLAKKNLVDFIEVIKPLIENLQQ